MKARILVIVSLVVMLAFGFSSAVCPQGKGYPKKPIQLILPIAAGGGYDLFFRVLADELQKRWEVPINILNKPAAGGALACGEVAKAKNDGYTMLATLLLQPVSMTVADPEGPVNVLRDFDPIFVNYGYACVIFVSRGDSEFKSLKDVVDYARKNPGKVIFGAGKAGTHLYLETMLLKREAKIDIAVLPYTKGPVESHPALLGGHVHVAVTSDAMAYPYIKEGRMRGLVTDIKSKLVPEVPTFTEAGYPKINLVPHFGLLGPKGLAPEVIETWETGLGVVVKEPGLIRSVARLRYNLNIMMGTEKLKKFLKEEVDSYSRFSPEELGWKK